ncbi:Transcriptional regulator NanR [Sporomusa termitida]|uniref:Transcriptional regulator NanR n=1 Tax=Sporomusa termitida TaxID=2377 RepID=A0A517DYM0_9FIRM|nr:FadR/GntR family transcriptional regulator [Sporomusa termitida]QDR82433.1 Transcriptional regulator NanR [Sporomusa termitida]
MGTNHLFHDREGMLRGNIFDVTVERLRTFIDSGILSAGDKLPSERELGEQLGVSRSILREALRVVESQGLITMVQGKGAYIRKPGLRTVIEPVQRLMRDGSITLGNLMQARAIIEPEVAKVASLNVTEAQIVKLEQDCRDMVKFLDFPEKYLQADKRFHSRLAEATGNPVLVIMMWPLLNLFAGFVPCFMSGQGLPSESLQPTGSYLMRLKTVIRRMLKN